MADEDARGRFVVVAPGQKLALHGDLVLVVLATVVCAPMARRLLEIGRAHGEGEALGVLYFVERGGVGVPDAESRAAWTDLSRSSGAYYAASSVVVPGGGLAAATAQTFVQAVRAVSGGRLPLAIFSDVLEAIRWLRQAMPAGARLPDDATIEGMLERLRAMT